jgi:hypothetical protein
MAEMYRGKISLFAGPVDKEFDERGRFWHGSS